MVVKLVHILKIKNTKINLTNDEIYMFIDKINEIKLGSIAEKTICNHFYFGQFFQIYLIMSKLSYLISSIIKIVYTIF